MELNYTERETRGLQRVMECLADAMKFELYHRVDKQDASNHGPRPSSSFIDYFSIFNVQKYAARAKTPG